VQKLKRNTDRSAKEPFNFAVAMRKLRSALRTYTKAAMFELADEGFSSLFEQLVACIISVRTLEAVTLATSRKLFAVARTPRQIAPPFQCNRSMS
jgi:endonuclease-3